MENLVSLGQWAIAHGITPDTARQRAIRGAFKTARKIGRNWVIDESEELVDHRKKDLTTSVYKEIFGVKENHEDVNRYMKAIIVNFGQGDIIVENDNFGTRRKYADFTNGKKKAGLHPLQIVFSGVETARILHERYIDKDGNICTF